MTNRGNASKRSGSNPTGLGYAINALLSAAAEALRRLMALRRLFLSYQGTDSEVPVRREQATILFGVSFLFALLGMSSCTLFTLAFEQMRNPAIVAAYFAVITLYVNFVGKQSALEATP